jgi:hypothetical protein
MHEIKPVLLQDYLIIKNGVMAYQQTTGYGKQTALQYLFPKRKKTHIVTLSLSKDDSIDKSFRHPY